MLLCIISGPTEPWDKNKNLWLFDILADPLEEHDLSDSHPDVVKMLLDRLQYYNSTAVPCQWPAVATAANPKNHGGFWGPWVIDPKTQAEEDHEGEHEEDKVREEGENEGVREEGNGGERGKENVEDKEEPDSKQDMIIGGSKATADFHVVENYVDNTSSISKSVWGVFWLTILGVCLLVWKRISS